MIEVTYFFLGEAHFFRNLNPKSSNVSDFSDQNCHFFCKKLSATAQSLTKYTVTLEVSKCSNSNFLIS